MLFTKPKVKHESIASREFKASHFIPYKCHFDDKTIIDKEGNLYQFLKIGGFSHETADDDLLDAQQELRNLLLKGIAVGEIGMYFHLIRKKANKVLRKHVSVDMPLGFAGYIDEKWREKYQEKDSYINELFITIIRRKSPGGTIYAVEKIIKKIMNFGDRNSQNAELLSNYEDLEETTIRVQNSLRHYNAELLGIREENGKHYSEPIEFLYRIANCGVEKKCLVPQGEISESLINHRLFFGKKAMEIKMHDGSSKVGIMVSMKEYPPKTWPGFLDNFLQLKGEYIISQSWEFTDKTSAIARMQLQQNRMIQAEDRGVSQIQEISAAIDMAISGEIGFGVHHCSVLCIADTLREAEQDASLASVELTNTGGIGARETVNLEPAFWGQLPGNYQYLVRRSTINTLNLASFNSMHNFPVGKRTGNHWGDAVTLLETTSGTPYFFNFHVRDVGHTTIIGPTGSGKTVLMTFLCAQAQRFKARLFFFDKDRGAEIFIRAIGGKYSIIEPSQPCGFNPLLLPETGENKTFLVDWLKQLLSVNGEKITAEETAIITRAVNGNYKLKPEDRRLSNIAPFLGIEGPNSLANRIAMWHGKGSRAMVFDNQHDVIDFQESSTFGFEMGELLKDKVSLGPVLAYLFHRISLSLDGTPTMIVLDEAWALIDNPVFAPKIKDWLKVLRKLNTFVVFATQSVEDASSSDISDTLIQQTATQIFLPNLKATEVYRTKFMLTQREFSLIKKTDPGTRYFLVKQNNDAVIARVDLSGMSDIVNVLSGRAETVLILDSVIKEHGTDPEVWIPIFNERLKSV